MDLVIPAEARNRDEIIPETLLISTRGQRKRDGIEGRLLDFLDSTGPDHRIIWL